MSASKINTSTDWSDEDEIPDLSTPAWAQKFDKAPVKRGRPLSKNKKELTTLRLDADILQYFKAFGAGWQSRINASLRKEIEADKNNAKKSA